MGLLPVLYDTFVFTALGASVVMGIVMLPMVSSLSEDAMLAVPNSLGAGAYALGGPSWRWRPW